MSARSEHDDALVLRSVDYRDADRIVTLLTRRHGKLSALARSARNSKRRFAGALEGFALLDIEVAIGNSELAHLQSARVTRVFSNLLADLSRLTAAGALLRLARELIPERVPDDEIFDALLASLEAFDRIDLPVAPLQICLELQLLALTGFAPLLSACGRCGKRAEQGRAADFDPRRGSLICQACGGASLRLNGSLRERMLAAISGDVISALQTDGETNAALQTDGETNAASQTDDPQAGAWSPDDLATARRLLENFIAHRLARPGRAVPNDPV
ncbi:MAG TPA: DNA repair protein RecO [Polyangiales bacterium]|nr:DNA repair protein RecO [Polyangiales bacterium]